MSLVKFLTWVDWILFNVKEKKEKSGVYTQRYQVLVKPKISFFSIYKI